MSDDQDGCEWVSVSSSTGLPRVVPDQRPLNGRRRRCRLHISVAVLLFSCSSLLNCNKVH